jgi:hypothetical protein
MAFKMNGSPAKLGKIQGTVGHGSALKKVLFDGPYEKALKKDPNLASYISERSKHKPGSDAYEAAQAKINAAYGKVRSQKLKAAQIKKGEKGEKGEKKDFVKTVGEKLKEGHETRKISDADYKKNRKAGESKYQYKLRTKK